jgi:hypothetical protein
VIPAFDFGRHKEIALPETSSKFFLMYSSCSDIFHSINVVLNSTYVRESASRKNEFNYCKILRIMTQAVSTQTAKTSSRWLGLRYRYIA